ncbi:Imm40 family immunity protein [Dyella sp. 333MFSha]|uniref:Imm40 family immunity protein n=1 Tax=Dyella sp. 333MFSha TaxID=1798240 RepID=UPI0008818BC5|nr:Imm40 family immunity protein [Dyella sp. 333MFSha]SDF27170.1 Immunity protein 40 [Dyella sp. 333MFSha]
MSLPSPFLNWVRHRGVSVMDAFGTEDVALDAEDAIEAAQLLADTGVAVLGGDVFFRTAQGFELAYANWCSNPRPGENAAAYAARSIRETCDYIRDFPIRPDRTAIFALVVSEVF